MRINGVEVASSIYAHLSRLPIPKRRMVAVLVGDNTASASFVARKAQAAAKLGIIFETVSFKVGEPQENIIEALHLFSNDPQVGGVILQLPLPNGYDCAAVIAAISPAKDPDNLSGVASVVAPAVLTVESVITSAGKAWTDFSAVRIVGNGFLVGAPIVKRCSLLDVSYAVADISTRDISAFVGGGDLVITGVGKPGLIDPVWIRDGAGFIDFGFPPDADQKKLMVNATRFIFYTPTPHGTGPILIARLFENFYALNG